MVMNGSHEPLNPVGERADQMKRGPTQWNTHTQWWRGIEGSGMQEECAGRGLTGVHLWQVDGGVAVDQQRGLVQCDRRRHHDVRQLVILRGV